MKNKKNSNEPKKSIKRGFKNEAYFSSEEEEKNFYDKLNEQFLREYRKILQKEIKATKNLNSQKKGK